MIDPKNLVRRSFAASLLLLVPMLASGQPSFRTNARMVYDASLRQPVLFGGVTPVHTVGDNRFARGFISETWVWNGRRWLQRFYDGKPQGRAAFAMEWDSNRQRVLLFGGAAGDTLSLNDTWQFRDGSWSRIDTPNAPEPRRGPGSAFDPLRDRLVIFGGFEGSTNFRDTWEFDGTTWTRTAENGPDVLNPILVYDAARAEILMMATITTGDSVMYRYRDAAWEQITPEAKPACVDLADMVFEEHSGRVLLVGGRCLNGAAPGETWEWDGTNWTKVTTKGTPGGVHSHALTYDAARGETLLFGGTELGFDRNDTYRYRHGRWTRAADTYTPAPRALVVFESDPDTGAIWLFGGVNTGPDLWKFQYGRWERVIAEGAPNACLNPVGTWDSDRKRLVVVCDDANVFEFDRTRWTAFTDMEERPPYRRWSGIAYDPNLRKTLLYGGFDGGNYINETWTWDGARWTRIEGKDAFRRSLPIMFYDATRKKVVLYGGIGRKSRQGVLVRFADTWEFNGRDWVEVTGAESPAARYGSFVALDPTTGLVHMFGGKDVNEQFTNEHFVWNGSKWAPFDGVNPPSPRQTGGLAWDPSTGEMTLFGGYAGYYLGDVWRLNGSAWQPEPDEGRKTRPATLPSVTEQAPVRTPQLERSGAF